MDPSQSLKETREGSGFQLDDDHNGRRAHVRDVVVRPNAKNRRGDVNGCGCVLSFADA